MSVSTNFVNTDGGMMADYPLEGTITLKDGSALRGGKFLVEGAGVWYVTDDEHGATWRWYPARLVISIDRFVPNEPSRKP
jgi:hypothetical protein